MATTWRVLILLIGMMVLASANAGELRLPFKGTWFVMQGGDTLNVNHHMAAREQWYGADFAKVGGASNRELSRPDPKRVEDFFSWNESVLAPAAGEIVAVVSDLPDNPLGSKDRTHPAGNHLVIRQAPDRFLVLAHFRQGSILVTPGDRVVSGQLLGKCGNSGNTDFPHIHLHLQDRLPPQPASGQNLVFSSMDVELTGVAFKRVRWPVIRGLFLTSH